MMDSGKNHLVMSDIDWKHVDINIAARFSLFSHQIHVVSILM